MVHGESQRHSLRGTIAVLHACTVLSLLAAAGCGLFRGSPASPAGDADSAAAAAAAGVGPWAARFAAELDAIPFPAGHATPPTLVAMGVVDLSNSGGQFDGLADDVAARLAAAGSVVAIASDDRDRLLSRGGYTLARCRDETRIALARTLHARYMLKATILPATAAPPGGGAGLQAVIEITDLNSELVVVRRVRAHPAERPGFGPTK